MGPVDFQDLFTPRSPAELTPLQVGAWELEQDLQKIGQQWEPLSRLLGSEEIFLTRDEAVSGWSSGEQAGHSVLVLQLVATVIGRLLAHPDTDVEKQPSDFTRQIFQDGSFPRGRAKAPKHVLPFDRTRQDFLAVLEGARENWNRLLKRSDELAACPGRYPHFVFGYLTPAWWTRLSAIHTAHHLKVVADILRISY